MTKHKTAQNHIDKKVNQDYTIPHKNVIPKMLQLKTSPSNLTIVGFLIGLLFHSYSMLGRSPKANFVQLFQRLQARMVFNQNELLTFIVALQLSLCGIV